MHPVNCIVWNILTNVVCSMCSPVPGTETCSVTGAGDTGGWILWPAHHHPDQNA